MAVSTPPYETVQDLIDRRTEGTSGDFKRPHHENSAELIHDVLCLANAGHDGDRYAPSARSHAGYYAACIFWSRQP